MNITINELLLNKQVKFGQGETSKTTTVEAPVPQTQSADAGMKALTFKGMQNLMANPQLAQNVSFGSKANAAKVLTGTAMAAAAMMAASCQDKISQEQNVDVKIDIPTEITTLLTTIANDLKTLISQGEATQTFQKAYLTAMANVTSMIQQGFADLKDYAKLVIRGMADDKDLQNQIFAELKAQGKNDTEARAYFAEKVGNIIKLLEEGKIDLAAAVQMLNNIDGHVASIDAKLDNVIAHLNTISINLDEIKKENAAYHKQDLMYDKQTNMLLGINNQLLGIGNMQRNQQIENDEKTYNEIVNFRNDFNAKTDSLIVLGNEQPEKLIETINNAVMRGEKLATMLNWRTNMSLAEINKSINDFKNGQLAWDEKFYELQVENNKLFKTYLPLIKNITPDNSSLLLKLQEVLDAINKNTEVTQDGVNATKEDVEAQKEANRLLKELIAKADPFIEGVNNHMKNVEKNWNTLLPLIKAASDKAGTQRDVIINLIKDYFPDFKAALEGIEDNTDSLNVIGGSPSNPLTISDLDQLLNKYTNKINDNNDDNAEKYQKPLSTLLQKILNDLDEIKDDVNAMREDMPNLDHDNDGLWLKDLDDIVKKIYEALLVDEGVH